MLGWRLLPELGRKSKSKLKIEDSTSPMIFNHFVLFQLWLLIASN